MTSDSDPHRDSTGAAPRSWDWVSHRNFSATPFYKEAWKILKQDWLVIVWKLGADFVARALLMVIGLMVLTLFIIETQLYVAAGGHPILWIDHIIGIIRTPNFFAGFVGTLCFAALLATALQALVVGGIWGLIDVGLRGESIDRWSTFWHHAVARFPEVLALYLLRFAVGVITLFLGVAVFLVIYDSYLSGALQAAPRWVVVVASAGSLTCLMGWAGLTRLALEAIGAPLVIDDVELGEAILRGGAFVLDNFWSLYRLLIFALGVLLVPLGIYWVAIMLNNLTLLVPELSALGSILQLLGQILVTVALSVVGIFFYGALFAFYHRDDAAVANERDASRSDEKAQPGPFRRGATLSDFLPERSPYRFDVDDILPAQSSLRSDASERSTDPESDGDTPALKNSPQNPSKDDGADDQDGEEDSEK